MPVNAGLAQLSDRLVIITVVIYSVALLAYAAELAYGRSRKPSGESAAVVTEPAQTRAPVTVGAGPPDQGSAQAPDDSDGASGLPQAETAGEATPASRFTRSALALTILGLAVHVTVIATRGMAAHRVPWGNMYEFVVAITCGAVAVYLIIALRFRASYLGLFVMVPVVLGLGLCTTVLYTPVGPLMPALHSYWIAIHVTAAILASGTFMVAAATSVMYLLADRYATRRAAGQKVGFSAITRRLPTAQVLDRISYRTVVFAFPIWTFAIIAGAIWADQAWGRYWAWDPKETWSFITWVVYAGFLHARATAGWRGRRAAYIQLAGFACLMFNLAGVNILITGLHSYAGL